jgi:hypothetical protein
MRYENKGCVNGLSMYMRADEIRQDVSNALLRTALMVS